MHKKTCDDYPPGRWHNDYMRHVREGTVPCAKAKIGWRTYQRKIRNKARMERRKVW